MKKLSKLKLSSFLDDELSKQEQNALVGGQCISCSCSCLYYGPKEGPNDSYHGGSSTADNDAANDSHGLVDSIIDFFS